MHFYIKETHEFDIFLILLNLALNKTSNSIQSNDTSSGTEPTIYNNIMHFLSKQVAKSRNQQKSSPSLHHQTRNILGKRITKKQDKSVGCCCFKNSKNKRYHSVMNRVEFPTTPIKHKDVVSDNVPEFSNKTIDNIHTSMILTQSIDMNDEAMDKAELVY